MENKQYNLFSEILYMIDTWCDSEVSSANRNDFISQVHNQWRMFEAYPRMVSLTRKSITVVWSNEFRDKYIRKSK